MRKPKTKGKDWLGHSLASFNGFGYADRSSAPAFVVSYVDYKRFRNLHDQADMAVDNYFFALDVAKKLLLNKDFVAPTPSEKNFTQFQEYRETQSAPLEWL